MLRNALSALALALVIAVPASAQTADDIIAKNLDAKGGIARQKAVQSVRMTGKMTLGPGIEAPIVLEMKRPKSMRIDISFQGMTITQAYDGTTAWMLNPMSGRTDPEPMPSEAVKLIEEQADMDGPLMDYKAKGSTVELLGKEKAEGTDCYKLKVTLKNGDVRTFYIDTETYLDVKLESKTMLRGSEQVSDTIVGDYKEVGGMMMAHSIDSGQPGAAGRQKMTVEKIELNVPIEDARFTMPVKK
ncbi:MAG: outer membrane lipoprotein-sorting protein [Acidobacteria bacterium]|nr:outer membrane lipoprotein-sorting protein [Acidobacteriota bacterium]